MRPGSGTSPEADAGVHREKLDEQASDIQQEARMVLPGVQALFGFELVGAFNQRFSELAEIDRTLYFVSLVLTTCSVGLLMAPAAYHRIAERGIVSAYFIAMSSLLIAVAMVPLALALCLDVYVISRIVFPHAAVWICVTIAGTLSIVLAGLWFAFPLWRRHRR